uniref:Endonuclease/exonuclease/phosphatase domain-containing protein n=1 Tax=Anabas testudineus TaxID=64144 RepID=A0A3Q1GX90_ANATE
MWPGTDVADGTRYVKVKFNDTVLVHNDAGGRLLVVDILRGVERLRVMNLYGPNGEGERAAFFRRCRRWVDAQSVVIGDWNVVMTRADVGVHNTFKSDTSRTAVLNWMSESDLVDAWRLLNPTARAYSRRQVVLGKLKQSRIDMCMLAT